VNRIIELLEDAEKKQIWGDHYLGTLPKIGETLWYVATWPASTLKCAGRTGIFPTLGSTFCPGAKGVWRAIGRRSSPTRTPRSELEQIRRDQRDQAAP
jgi:hypothetical protein